MLAILMLEEDVDERGLAVDADRVEEVAGGG
jgi:hypothetical protein